MEIRPLQIRDEIEVGSPRYKWFIHYTRVIELARIQTYTKLRVESDFDI